MYMYNVHVHVHCRCMCCVTSVSVPGEEGLITRHFLVCWQSLEDASHEKAIDLLKGATGQPLLFTGHRHWLGVCF